jgi:hypothetical protein
LGSGWSIKISVTKTQWCQGAEISAAKLKKGPGKNSLGTDKSGTKSFAKFIKKMGQKAA